MRRAATEAAFLQSQAHDLVGSMMPAFTMSV
jgi:hypothetical protein